MAHKVKIQTPIQEVGNSDFIFHAENDEGKIGRLKVSKGAVVWTPANGKKGWKVSWTQLGDLVKSKNNKE